MKRSPWQLRPQLLCGEWSSSCLKERRYDAWNCSWIYYCQLLTLHDMKPLIYSLMFQLNCIRIGCVSWCQPFGTVNIMSWPTSDQSKWVVILGLKNMISVEHFNHWSWCHHSHCWINICPAIILSYPPSWCRLYHKNSLDLQGVFFMILLLVD